MTDRLLIEEILTKECERYELEKSGFVTDRRAAVEELLSADAVGTLSADGATLSALEGCSLQEFVEWRSRLLHGWYSRKGFAKFFCRKAEKRCMFPMVKRLMQNVLSRLRRKQTESTVDDELRLEEGRTVAFKLSSALYAELYPEICCSGTLYATPGQLEEACVNRVHTMFPLKYPSLYERLTAKDSEFWEEVWRLIRRFVHFLVTEKKRAEDEEAVEEVSMETVLSVQEQMEKGRLEQIVSASHLLNSLQMTGRNKFREWVRAEEKKQEEVLLEEEDVRWQESQYLDMTGMDRIDGRFAYLLEVNEGNEFDVRCALVDVLNYGSGAVYEALVEGMQETATVISMLYVENKKYEEIARVLYGEADGKRLANLRKLVSRGKEYLKKRMAELIVNYKRKGQVPFVNEEEE